MFLVGDDGGFRADFKFEGRHEVLRCRELLAIWFVCTHTSDCRPFHAKREGLASLRYNHRIACMQRGASFYECSKPINLKHDDDLGMQPYDNSEEVKATHTARSLDISRCSLCRSSPVRGEPVPRLAQGWDAVSKLSCRKQSLGLLEQVPDTGICRSALSGHA